MQRNFEDVIASLTSMQAMILAHERSQYYAELLSAIKGAVFFGTPHRGSDLAYWATFAATLANVVQLGRNTNTTYVKGLKENSKEFAHIAQQWIERGSKLQIRTFYETERYNGMLVCLKNFSNRSKSRLTSSRRWWTKLLHCWV